MKNSNLFLIIGLAVLFGAGFTLFFMSDLIGESSTYTDFGTARKLKKTVHVVGQWVKRDDYTYDNQNDILNFWLADTLGETLRVTYHDPMPANFESAEKIVVIGKVKEDHFEAELIQMKCPSKYNAKQIGGESMPDNERHRQMKSGGEWK